MNEVSNTSSAAPASSSTEVYPSEDVDLIDILTVFAKHKVMIAFATLGAAIISLIVVLLMPKIYTGTTVLMPPQQDQSSATVLLGQLIGGGSATTGSSIASALGLKNPNDLYVGILRSRTIADTLIKRFKLQRLYDDDTLVDARKDLADATTITAEKNGLITIDFEDKDPKRAAEIANAYVEELKNLTAHLAISDASRRRVYYQKQVNDAEDRLTDADTALSEVQEKTGLIKPGDQASAIFGAIATLRGQITAKEVELNGIKTFATAQNPAYVRGQEELDTLKKQLAGLERTNKLGSGNILIPTAKVPAASVEILEKWRKVKYYETLYGLLANQLELAKIDEGKDATIIQAIDKAVALPCC